jgi:hypothetical protein
MTSSDRAVRKASGARLARDMRWAARCVLAWRAMGADPETVLLWAGTMRSRTRYACLLTAWGR